MKFSFKDTGAKGHLDSLHSEFKFAKLIVAGTTLRQAQIDYLQAEGHHFDEAGAEVILAENFWYNAQDLHALANNQDLSELSFSIQYPWDLLKINEFLVSAFDSDDIQGTVYPGAQFEGKVKIGEGSKILPGVFIEGNVVIGKDCKIGPNCYIRGNTSIGNKCHIGQSVEIKNSIIMHNTNVGHLSYIGDSVLGIKANLGAGTVSSNLRHDGANHKSLVNDELIDTGRRKFGVIIGDGVHTGINTSLYPGRKIYPGQSTRPGEIVQKDIK